MDEAFEERCDQRSFLLNPQFYSTAEEGFDSYKVIDRASTVSADEEQILRLRI